jgi:glyoxylase-like metal-dependent hydrolase (beta-lactamase superfamily II)
MATAAEPQPASLPLPGARDDATVRLTPLLTATVQATPAYIHRVEGRTSTLKVLGLGVSREEMLTLPVQAFLLEHPGAGTVLVDTGYHASVAVEPRQNLGRVGAFISRGIEMDPEKAVAAQLRERGIEPSSVRVVIMTHLHLDHASAMADFPGATFLISREEWEAATDGQPWRHGYVPRQFDHAFDYRLVDFDSAETDSFSSFGRAFDVFGDGSVRIVSTPGHTLGHMSVVVRTEGREVLLAGDAIYTERALSEGALPFLMEDPHRFRRSLREIQLYAEQAPDALIVPGHDLDFFERLEPVY